MTDRPLYDRPEIVGYYPAHEEVGENLISWGTIYPTQETMDFFLMNVKILMRKLRGKSKFDWGKKADSTFSTSLINYFSN